MDAYDASFMSSKRLNALKILLNHPNISLLTMNFPHSSMNGVIPLCMAAWLNLPEAVRVLLEESVDSVSVDGMDAHGATALMCESYIYFSAVTFFSYAFFACQTPLVTVVWTSSEYWYVHTN